MKIIVDAKEEKTKEYGKYSFRQNTVIWFYYVDETTGETCRASEWVYGKIQSFDNINAGESYDLEKENGYVSKLEPCPRCELPKPLRQLHLISVRADLVEDCRIISPMPGLLYPASEPPFCNLHLFRL